MSDLELTSMDWVYTLIYLLLHYLHVQTPTKLVPLANIILSTGSDMYERYAL